MNTMPNSGPIITQAGSKPRRWRFADFRATGRWVEDLGAELNDKYLEGTGGRMYAGCCWIAYTAVAPRGEHWCVTIGNRSWSGTLLRMEKMLFLWAAIECHPDGRTPAAVERSF